MKNIVLISASPKLNEQSVSEKCLEMAGNLLKGERFALSFIDVRKSLSRHLLDEDFRTIAEADALILSFPLYFFGLPGLLTRFLGDYYKYYQDKNPAGKKTRIYAIVNCGFPEPEINLEAVRVIKSFSRHINAEFRFGILIGGGPMLLVLNQGLLFAKTRQKLNEAFSTVAEDIQAASCAEKEHFYIGISLPRRFYLFMGSRNWYADARKQGLKKEDLKRQPYRAVQ